MKPIYLLLPLLASTHILAANWEVYEGNHQVEFSNSKLESSETLINVKVSRSDKETITCSVETKVSTHRFHIETRDAFSVMDIVSLINFEVTEIPEFISKTQKFIDHS